MTSTTSDSASGYARGPQGHGTETRLVFVTHEGIVDAGAHATPPRVGEHVRLPLPRSGTIVVGRITFVVWSVLPGGLVCHAVVEVPKDPPLLPEWARDVIATRP